MYRPHSRTGPSRAFGAHYDDDGEYLREVGRVVLIARIPVCCEHVPLQDAIQRYRVFLPILAGRIGHYMGLMRRPAVLPMGAERIDHTEAECNFRRRPFADAGFETLGTESS